MTNSAAILLLAGGLALGACQKANQPDSKPLPLKPIPAPVSGELETAPGQPGQAPMVPASRVASAAEAIAEARCARELRCENIGAGRAHATMNDCVANVRATWGDELRARECSGDQVNQPQLDECVTEVRNDDCRNPFGALGRVASCTADQICGAAQPPP